MAKSSMLDRIKFSKKGVQSKFIFNAKELLSLKWSGLAKKLKVNPRTLSDWKKEKFNMSVASAKTIAKLTKLTIPREHTIIRWSNHMRDISKNGGHAVVVKYGKIPVNEEYRKEKWRQWWKEVGQYRKNAEGFQSIIKIKIPTKNRLLSEFVGIMLGDGGVNKYHTSITLSSKEGRYIFFVKNIIIDLFGVTPKIYRLKYANAIKIATNRKQLVNFCKQIGLIQGNKTTHQVDIPEWIKENKEFSKACVRGLIDTDGCFYTNSYYVGRKKYSYFKIAFTNASLPLIKSVAEILTKLKIQSRISKNKKDVRIENNQNVHKFIKEIGSHNQKHLQKIKKWKNTKNMLK